MKLSTGGRNGATDTLLALLNVGGLSGSLKVYTGAAPTHCSDAASGTLLATLPLSVTSFGASSGGTATANAITSDTSIDSSGTAGYFRFLSSAGTVILQGSVGTSGAELNFDSINFVAGGTCACSAFTVTCPEGT